MQPYIIFELQALTNLLKSIQCCKRDTLEFSDSIFDEKSVTFETFCCKNQINLDKFYKVSTIAEFHSAGEHMFGNGEYENVFYIDENMLTRQLNKATTIENILIELEGDIVNIPEDPSEDPLSLNLPDNYKLDVMKTKSKLIPRTLPTYANSEHPAKVKYPEVLCCEFCGKVFKGRNRAYKFSYHRNKMHTQNLTFKCPQCQKVFFGERELTDHAMCHDSCKNICHLCGKTWSNRYHLDRHILVHMTEKRFMCSFCKKEFKRNDHLKVHERIHNGHLPFLCATCGSGYAQKIQLNLHYKRCPLRDQNSPTSSS